MSENKSNICPCCPKGCDLSTPRCDRGEEYLRTGIIPEKSTRNHHQARQHHEEQQQHPNYQEMNIDEKLSMLLSRLGRARRGSADGKSSQNRILQILSKSEHMTQRELTVQLGIQPGSASEIIKKLEHAGLITRQSNSEDRRTADIALTDAGKAQAEANSARHANHTLFESLTDDEKQQLLALLERLDQDWHTRFRGEGRSEYKHHGEEERNFKQRREGKHDKEQEHHRDDKRGHDSDHGYGHKQGRRHHHDSF